MEDDMLEQRYFINKKTGLMYIEEYDVADSNLTESLKYTGDTTDVTEVTKEEYEEVLVAARKKRDDVIAEKTKLYIESLDNATALRKKVIAKVAKSLGITEEEASLIVNMPELEKGAGMEISEKL